MNQVICKKLIKNLGEAKTIVGNFDATKVASTKSIEARNRLVFLLDEIKFLLLNKEFSKRYPGAMIEKIDPNKIPSNIMDSFEHQSTMYIHPDDYEKGNFIQFYIIHRVDPPYTTYVAEQDKIIDKDEKEEMTDKLHYFIDNPDDLGAKKLDEIRFIIDNDSSYFKNKPFTFFSKNGTDRLKLMNAFCQSRLGLPMYSGTMLEDEEHEFWKELVEEGLAQQYEEESGRDLKTRYKFKD